MGACECVAVFRSLCAALFITAQFLLFLLVRTRVNFVAQSGELKWGSCMPPDAPQAPTRHHRGVCKHITALGLGRHIQCKYMCIYYFTRLACILQQRSVDTINYQFYFHFIFLSLISLPACQPASQPSSQPDRIWGCVPQWNQKASMLGPPNRSGRNSYAM